MIHDRLLIHIDYRIPLMSFTERGAVPSHWRLKGEKNGKKKGLSAKDCICQGMCNYHDLMI